MADHDHMKAAEPNWLDQASSQLSDLRATLEEINDPTALELLEAVDDRMDDLSRQAAKDREGD
ncbi:MAG: hypothetical protein ABJN42_03545 [Roseibium sp.]|uniref:hypothetical protein n=1 Tax=Roseibium sp. TaxID=1936156 RepID=UPI0032984451